MKSKALACSSIGPLPLRTGKGVGGTFSLLLHEIDIIPYPNALENRNKTAEMCFDLREKAPSNPAD
jgi:hypothetical protein